jgi:hypothetical protein
MPMLLMMPLTLMLVIEFLLPLWGAYRVYFSLSLFPLPSSVEGTSLTTSFRYQDSRLEIS